MRTGKNTNAKKALGVSLLVVAAVVTGFALKSMVARAGNPAAAQQGRRETTKLGLPRGRADYRVYTVRKRAKPEGGAADRPSSVTVRLNGLLPADYVNIRPSDESAVQASAGVLFTKTDETPRSAALLPESALDVSAGEVVFNRPEHLAGSVVVDVQLPRGTQTQVSADRNVLLNSALEEAVSVSGGKVGRGGAGAVEALAQAVAPEGLKGKSLDLSVRRLEESDKYFVPFSSLQVTRKVEFDASLPQNRAALEINEEGRVVKVTTFDKNHSPGVEEALKQWEFAPFSVEGRAVPVLTIVSPASAR